MRLPRHHAVVLDRVKRAVADDPRLVGLAAGGSLLTGGVDEYSDLDLVVVVDDEHHETVMRERKDIARSWGPLLACFTGDHVGEPRLLICLYADPLMHVDLKFLRADELAQRMEDPVVLWERGRTVSRSLDATTARPHAFDVQWLEDRFWTWVHYAAAKLGRGELFEVLDFLTFLRGQALAPLALHLRGISPRGVRRLEQHAPDLLPAFAGTVASYDAADCARALVHCVDLYRRLRERLSQPPHVDTAAEVAAVRYLDEVVATVEAPCARP